MALSKKINLLIISSISIVLLVSASLTLFFVLKNRTNNEHLFDPIDVFLPSNSTGDPEGTLALRIYLPENGISRYPEGAPVLIWGYGGGTAGGLGNPADPINDSIVINFLYPGGEDTWAGTQSDGIYDYRGENCILALKDVILFAAGEKVDENGKAIDDLLPIDVIHNNIGLLGESFGGNIIVAVAALHGEELAAYLKYIIQWETPASSQITNLDLGRVLPSPGEMGVQLDLYNPRYLAYGKKSLLVNYSDLFYNPLEEQYQIFHDGNGDGQYTTVPISGGSDLETPDLNLDNILTIDEDFPINYCFFEEINGKRYYSRNVTHALDDNGVFAGPWPSEIATPEEADNYWNLREAVRFYEEAVNKIPNLKAMVLVGERDHVQSHPEKPNIHQAFDGWNDLGVWVKINPLPSYIKSVHPSFMSRLDLPTNFPNIPPSNWSDHESYCIPMDINKEIYQTAAFWEMADKTQQSLQLQKKCSQISNRNNLVGGHINKVTIHPVGSKMYSLANRLIGRILLKSRI